VIALAEQLRSAVLPHIGSPGARASAGRAHSGDVTFAIDEVAERALEEFVAATSGRLAYFSEDRGLVGPRQPEGILLVDPIDGTRGAMCGLESCVASVAWVDPVPDARLRDVRFACVRELRGDLVFTARRGMGAEVRTAFGDARPIALSTVAEPHLMRWNLDIVGRPARLIAGAAEELMDASSKTGAVFMLNSIAFSVTRLLTGQLDAAVDPGTRLLREVPGAREQFLRLGGGTPMALFPYDIAAVLLIATEAGAVVTDAWGRDLSDVPAFDCSEANGQSMVAAANHQLHARILEALERGIAKLRGDTE
jgi:myo-inositol-1(or 4)-monophosphatase